MALQVTVKITGLDKAITANSDFAASIHDWQEALTGLGTTLTEYYSSAPWVSDGTIFGEAWRALKATTVKEKTRHMGDMATGGSPAQPLIRTGAMKAGFQFKAGSNELFIDNKVKYWKYHQTGTGEKGDGVVPGVGRGLNLPQRMTAGVDAPVKAMIQVAINESVETKIKASYGS